MSLLMKQAALFLTASLNVEFPTLILTCKLFTLLINNKNNNNNFIKPSNQVAYFILSNRPQANIIPQPIAET